MSRHLRTLNGYMSQRCGFAVDGCEDLACVCSCHDETPASIAAELRAMADHHERDAPGFAGILRRNAQQLDDGDLSPLHNPRDVEIALRPRSMDGQIQYLTGQVAELLADRQDLREALAAAIAHQWECAQLTSQEATEAGNDRG